MVRILTIAAVAVCMLGCRTYKGRLMEKGEDDLVGARAAGTETHSRLIDEALTKLLTRHEGEVKSAHAKVAFIDLENKSAEELGDFREQIIEIIETVVENSNRYRMISRRFVKTALNECRITPDQILLPRYRRQFAQVLEQQNNPVHFVLYAVLTSASARHSPFTAASSTGRSERATTRRWPC